MKHLIYVLQQCEELYKRMLPIIEEEKRAALEPDSFNLSKINDEKEGLLAQLKTLDRQRVMLLRQIAKELHLSLDQLTLITLAEKTAPAYRAQLISLNTSLKQIMVKVQYANDDSRLMVAHCLTLVKNTLNFFSRWTTSAAVYGSSGNMEAYGNGHGQLLSNSV